ncbi:hypothetical protein AB1Y20_002212 [Prymnesium parvum]|uniref:Myosin motor domain-containing protein n=1 Tax=Prymnesium parvum TaxID=97485 RepID=A0AB34J8H2_PRYPA
MRLAPLPVLVRTTCQCIGIVTLARYKGFSSSALRAAATQAVDGGVAATNARLSETVIRIQERLDMDEADLDKMLCRNASIPSYKFEDVDAKLRALNERLSLTQSDLKKMLIRFPKLLSADFEHSILPVLNNLERALDLDQITLRKIAVKCPNLLTSGIQEKISPIAKALKLRLQLDEVQMLRVAQAFPFVFCLDLEKNLLPKLDKIQARLNMDVEELRKFVLHAPQVLSLTYETNIKAKLDFFTELGLSEAELKHQANQPSNGRAFGVGACESSCALPLDSSGQPAAAVARAGATGAARTREITAGAAVWLRNGGAAASSFPFLAGRVTRLADGLADVALEPSEGLADAPTEVRVDVGSLALRHEAPPVDDKCLLEELNEATLLHNTLERARGEAPYTWLGPGQLLAVNPCRTIEGMYDEAACVRHMKAHGVDRATAPPPHPYAVAEDALSLLRRHEQVAVLVSGESGSGKTEAARQLVDFLSWRSANESKRSEQVSKAVQQGSHVLNAFGNAAMLANRNSSRFGKLLLVHLEPPTAVGGPALMTGARVETFLLEKSRLPSFAEGERNFHVLYQLAAAARAEPGDPSWKLNAEWDHYRFLCDDATRRGEAEFLPDVDEAGNELMMHEMMAIEKRNFSELNGELFALGASSAGLSELWRLLRVVLMLGQLKFAAPDAVHTEPLRNRYHNFVHAQTLFALQEILKDDFQHLRIALSATRILSPRSYTFTKLPFDRSQAKQARDTLATALYSTAFLAVVACINRQLSAHGAPRSARRGVAILDVFGFENLPRNSLEQLCINFTNEKLHAHYLDATIRGEAELLRAEGVRCDWPEHFANERIISRLEEGPHSLFMLLDSQCWLRSPSDTAFVVSLFQTPPREDWEGILLRPRPPLPQDEGFQIAHYSGVVQYSAEDFVRKNLDELSEVLAAFVERREEVLFAALVPGEPLPSEEEAAQRLASRSKKSGTEPLREASRKRRKQTFTAAYRSKLEQLLDSLHVADGSVRSMFVKCVKPNEELRAGVIDEGYVLRQLKAQGVLQAVEIARQGYPHHFKCEVVHEKFGKLIDELVARGSITSDLVGLAATTLVRALLEAEGLRQPKDFVMGRSMAFVRLGKAHLLDRLFSVPEQEAMKLLTNRLEEVKAHREDVRRRAGHNVKMAAIRERYDQEQEHARQQDMRRRAAHNVKLAAIHERREQEQERIRHQDVRRRAAHNVRMAAIHERASDGAASKASYGKLMTSPRASAVSSLGRSASTSVFRPDPLGRFHTQSPRLSAAAALRRGDPYSPRLSAAAALKRGDGYSPRLSATAALRRGDSSTYSPRLSAAAALRRGDTYSPRISAATALSGGNTQSPRLTAAAAFRGSAVDQPADPRRTYSAAKGKTAITGADKQQLRRRREQDAKIKPPLMAYAVQHPPSMPRLEMLPSSVAQGANAPLGGLGGNLILGLHPQLRALYFPHWNWNAKRRGSEYEPDGAEFKERRSLHVEILEHRSGENSPWAHPQIFFLLFGALVIAYLTLHSLL